MKSLLHTLELQMTINIVSQKNDGLLPLLRYKGTSLLIRWYYKKIMEYIQCNLLQALAALQIPRKY